MSLAERAELSQASVNIALDFLANTDFTAAKGGEVIEVDGKNIFAQVQEYLTAPADTLLFETHDVYIDIHYLVSGREEFACTPRNGLDVRKPYDGENDITFYENPEQCNVFVLNPGDSILVTPNAAHMPRRCAEVSTPVKKIVVKVKYTE